MTTLPALIQTEIAPIGRDLTRDEAKRLQDGEAGALSESTRRQYRMGWDRFAAWCDEAELVSLPATPEAVGLFLLAEGARGLKVPTLRQRLAAIRDRHEQAGHRSPTESKGVRNTMRSLRRSLGVAPKQAPAATADRVLAMASHADTETLVGLRDRALLLFGFASAMRRSELVSLDRGDLTETPNGYTVRLNRSKTDQEGKGHTRGIVKGANPESCPISAVNAWIAAAGITEGPLFRSVDRWGNLGARAEGRTVDRTVKRYAKAAKLDGAVTFGAHSLRAGFITSASKQGRPADRIMDHTGHKTHAMIRAYTRNEDLWRDHAGAGLL